jgi:hypothetical protein
MEEQIVNVDFHIRKAFLLGLIIEMYQLNLHRTVIQNIIPLILLIELFFLSENTPFYYFIFIINVNIKGNILYRKLFCYGFYNTAFLMLFCEARVEIQFH